MTEITDPALLSQLNAGTANGEVTDPQLLAQLNGSPTAPVRYDNTTQYDAQLGATSPVDAEIKQGIGNAAIGIGATYTDVAQRMHQLYNFIIGGPSMDAEIQQKRAMDAQINSTAGGKIGSALAFAPGSILIGPGVGANVAYGGLIGALRPTTSQDKLPFLHFPLGNAGATALNTVTGATIAGTTSGIGNRLANWAPTRATQPLSGWTPESGTAALTEGVGLNAPNFADGGLGQRAADLGSIFQAGRNSATSVDLGATPAAIDSLSADMNLSVRPMFEGNPNVTDLMAHATGNGTVSGAQLGRISTGLRQDAYAALNSEGGNREYGLALQGLREHVEDAIQSNIADPTMRAAYAAARPQYGLLQDIRYNPSTVNAATGQANMRTLGNFLQRNNPAYTAPGASDNPVFNAAMWGQAGGGAKGSPKFTLSSPWDKLFYWGSENPISRGVGGLTSRVIAPVGTQVRYGLSGLGVGTVPIALPYLEQ